MAERSAHTMQRGKALSEIEPGRKRIDIPGSIPLSELKAKKSLRSAIVRIIGVPVAAIGNAVAVPV